MIYTLRKNKTGETLAVDTKYIDEAVLEDWLYPSSSAPEDIDEIIEALVNTVQLFQGKDDEITEELDIEIIPFRPVVAA